MKIIDEEFAARLKSGVVNTCLCWKFERADGAVYGATDHDMELRIDDVSYLPDNALAGAQFVSNNGLAPGQVSGQSGLSASFINQEELRLGLWDGARVTVWRVDWEKPDLKYHVWSGFLGEVQSDGQSFQTELVSLKAKLETRIGRVYSRQCDAELGDARCGVELGNLAFQTVVTIAEILASDRLRVDDLSGFQSGWFSGGRVEFSDGRKIHIQSHENDLVFLSRAVDVKIDDELTLIAGCNKSFETCQRKFSNHINFQGFPHLPGMDAVLSGPSAKKVNDGGKR